MGSGTAALSRIAEIGRLYRDATHHCWAWRVGSPPVERCSDAGEPAGTAGKPILLTLRGAQLSDALVVVLRWFGGTKLGKGGLARAYAEATRRAVEGARLERRVPVTYVELELPYEKMGALRRLLWPPAVEMVREHYGEIARVLLKVERDRLVALRESLGELRIEAVSSNLLPSDGSSEQQGRSE